MKIDSQKVKFIASLAGFELVAEEVELYKKELSRILDFVEQLDEVSPGKEPLLEERNFFNVFEDDRPSEFLDKEKLLANFPVRERNFLKIKAVFKD